MKNLTDGGTNKLDAKDEPMGQKTMVDGYGSGICKKVPVRKPGYDRNLANYSDEWYTPFCVVEPLLPFDLDPCSPKVPLFKLAECTCSMPDDGLRQRWFGKVWLNPPYSNAKVWIQKLVEHGNGIALVFNRMDTTWFQKWVFQRASGILVLAGRIKFLRPSGEEGKNPGCGSVLIAYGKANAELLKKCWSDGKYRGMYLPLPPRESDELQQGFSVTWTSVLAFTDWQSEIIEMWQDAVS